MTRTILIGKGRRITLDELSGVCSGLDKLEVHVAAAAAAGGGGGPASNETDASDNNPPSGLSNDSNNASASDTNGSNEGNGGKNATDSLIDAFDAAAALQNLTIHDVHNPSQVEFLSPQATIAALTILSLTLAQGRVVRSKEEDGAANLSSALVDLVHRIHHTESNRNTNHTSFRFRLPSDPTKFGESLSQLMGSTLCPESMLLDIGDNGDHGNTVDDGVSKSAKPFLRRLVPLSRIALSLSHARSLASKSVADVMAALSAERLSGTILANGGSGGNGGNGGKGGKVNWSECFSSVQFDELRPHRGCIESAGVLRACLQGSTLAGGAAEGEGSGGCLGGEDVRFTQLTPQYHGPSREAIHNACKTLELEINCSESTHGAGMPEGGWDDTIAVLAVKNALEAVECLDHGSTMRVCGTADGQPNGETNHVESSTTATASSTNVLERSANSFENAVISLQRALEKEAFLACQFIHSELYRKEAELKAKEAEKAKRAAERTNDGTNNDGEPHQDGDEFAGMSAAQKAKILKKRAEKEAKAAAKRKAKEAKASGGEAALTGTFGAGTAVVYPLLMAAATEHYKRSFENSSASEADPHFSPSQVRVDEVLASPESFSSLLSPTASTSTSPSSSSSSSPPSPPLLPSLATALDNLLSGGLQRKPKVPKGTRDYLPPQMSIRSTAFQIIRRVFLRHGAVEIDTPVFELKETLTGKYGEDSKLIYDLADQGGELLALRYDLTVPFARFLAVHGVGNIKRFHIGKVYRRDQPALTRGRYREFYQCDFDIAGCYGRMVPDAECVAVACEILDALPIGDFGVKLNHRGLLDAILDLCGVPREKFRTICSAVDKLDKEPWGVVKREMVEEKGLREEVAERIGTFVVRRGKPWELYGELMGENKFGKHEGAARAMEDLRILFEYLDAMDKLQFITFDLSLARGLDYYTGVIYEAVCMNGNTQVGSIGGGGRYDNLVSMFQEAGKVTPCVGVSVGIERVFTLMEERLRAEHGGTIKQPTVSVLIASAGENLLPNRLSLAKTLWDANISAEFSQQENPKLKFEIANALEREIPFMVIAGEEEAKENKCKVKDLKNRTEETVRVEDLVKCLRGKGVVPVGCEFAMEILNGAD